MLNILLKPEAEKDLAKIFEHTFYNWGLKQAEKYQDQLFHGMQQLAKQEYIGKIYPFSSQQYRKLHVNRHLIFYRIEGETCIIVRVLHNKMQPDNYLK